MKPVKLVAIGLAAAACTLFTAAFISRETALKAQEQTHKGKGFAVLELFTSEGCSSCPPAEAVLARVQQQVGDKPVYLLAYHVDYWNRLGWKDSYSKSQFSRRQQDYSQQLAAQVYTPQLVINGQSEFVGSDEAAVNSSIEAALDGAGTAAINLKGQLQSGKLSFTYQVTGNSPASQLLIALVQKHAVSQVKRGENEGRTLSHVQVVRELQAFSLQHSATGSRQFSLPSEFNRNDWEVVGMVQDTQTGVIEAAGRLDLNL